MDQQIHLYSVEKSRLNRDKILTRMMQLYLNNQNNIDASDKRNFNSIYKEFAQLRSALFKKDSTNERVIVEKIRLLILYL